MLNSIKTKTKKIICSLVLCLGIVAAAFVNFQISKPTIVLANATNNIVKDVTSSDFGTGYNFNVTTSTKPVSPSGWTTLDASSFNSENIVKGVVNLESATTFDTDDCKTIRPSMPITDSSSVSDSAYYKNLMINSHNGSGRLGYESSNSITLQENSYYRISVYLYTQKTEESDNTKETDARASIYLTGLIDDKEDKQYHKTKFESISTLGAWEEYFFYVDTNESKNIKLQLWLGSQDSEVNGAVFFNRVKILRYSEDAYMQQLESFRNKETGLIEDENDDSYNIISLGTTADDIVENGNFEDVSLNGWNRIAQSTSNADHQVMKCVDANTFSNVNEDLTINPVGTNCSTDNLNALFMYNKTEGYQAIESAEAFTIKQHKYYKLSFWAKSDCNTGTGATVKLIDQAEKDPATDASLVLATSFTKDNNPFRNDWTKYSFYIYGPATGSKSAKIQIWLGSQDAATSGYIFVDDFKIEEIDYNTFSTNSSGANATTFNLNNAADKYTVANSNFDITQNTDSTTIYPAVPASWTRSGSDNTTTFSGIVNTLPENFEEEKYGQIITPVKPSALPKQNTEDNNVLMIGSSAETNSQTYKSNTLTLSANSYYSISFYTMTDYVRNMTNYNYGGRVKIFTDSINVFDYYNLHFADSNWHKFDVLIKTGAQDISPSIALTFENSIGYIFFDKVELKTINADTFNDNTLTTSEVNYFKVDLSEENFETHNYNKNLFATNGIDQITRWDFTNNSSTNVGVTYGIVDKNNELIEFAPTSNSENTKYMYISATHDGSYAYKSKSTHSFEAESYYKITVNVLTRNIHIEDELPEDAEEYIGGAYIYLADSSEILLKDIRTNEIWTTYTIYASFANALTSSIELGLGYTNETVQGEALFDDLTITKIDQATYLSEIQDADDSSTVSFINYEEPEEVPEVETTPWENNFNWFLIPSILTALAIIISVVGFYLRKIDISRKTKIKTNYDRRKTLDKDIDRREKIALRKQIISELEAELKSIDQEVEEFNLLANQQLEAVKSQIKAEQEELQKKKLEIEIRKSEAKAEREKKLKEDETFVSNTKAEKEYNNLLAKLDKQELSIQQKLTRKEFRITQVEEANQAKVSRFAERKEYIRQQIAKIEAEIEEIARQEEEIWAEYRAAKAEAKQRKTEYKAQIKKEKEAKKAEKARTQKAKEYQAKKTSKSSKKSDSKTSDSDKK